MNHGTRRNSPAGVEGRIKAENAAKGIAPLPENVAYDAARAEFA